MQTNNNTNVPFAHVDLARADTPVVCAAVCSHGARRPCVRPLVVRVEWFRGFRGLSCQATAIKVILLIDKYKCILDKIDI